MQLRERIIHFSSERFYKFYIFAIWLSIRLRLCRYLREQRWLISLMQLPLRSNFYTLTR